MKKFSIAFILLSIVSFSFVSPVKRQPAYPIRYDESNTGAYVFFNHCTNENVDVTFRNTTSFRGSANDQRVNFKFLYNESQEGIGQTSGTRYVGHVNESSNQSASFVNGTYLYSMNLNVRLSAPGGGNNFRSNLSLRYSFNSNGETTGFRTQEASECQ